MYCSKRWRELAIHAVTSDTSWTAKQFPRCSVVSATIKLVKSWVNWAGTSPCKQLTLLLSFELCATFTEAEPSAINEAVHIARSRQCHKSYRNEAKGLQFFF